MVTKFNRKIVELVQKISFFIKTIVFVYSLFQCHNNIPVPVRLVPWQPLTQHLNITPLYSYREKMTETQFESQNYPYR